MDRTLNYERFVFLQKQYLNYLNRMKNKNVKHRKLHYYNIEYDTLCGKYIIRDTNIPNFVSNDFEFEYPLFEDELEYLHSLR